ncbi:molybdopterin-dependent oxidoreductase [Roseomonas sp. BN140053]|uniref:molybdopterin-dependent oxidoreductase n=1 Tax=Roseomonas sp. BN140053 TaxID=3391898 RepID=UPI0039ED46E2
MVHSGSARSGLIVHSHRPFNAEPPLDRLRASFLTAQSDFYVRSHGDVPQLDAATHRLRVDGRVARPLDLSPDALRRDFPHSTVQAVLQCAGNRRGDLRQVRPVSGDPWSAGAIGYAAWTGVALAEVLRAAGAATGAELHVAFAAPDDCEAEGERYRFGASIPMRKALSPEVILAWAMNGEALTPAHGFPLRAVVPGFAGVRSVKWLTGITVQDRPSDARPQARDYKLFPPGVTAATADPAAGHTIEEMPLNAAICEPAPFAVLPAGPATLRGYAVATARRIARVDVSADGGRCWQQAALECDADAPWSWCFWQAVVELPPGEHELAVRAWDSAGQTQPARLDDTWNCKGYLNAAWHRVRVRAG